MALTTAERNKRKRERKKRERAEVQKRQKLDDESAKTEAGASTEGNDNNAPLEEVEIEYVAEPLLLSIGVGGRDGGDGGGWQSGGDTEGGGVKMNIEESSAAVDGGNEMEAILRRFQDRAAVSAYVTDEERTSGDGEGSGGDRDSGDDGLGDSASPDSDGDGGAMSKRKLKDLLRPTVAELKQRAERPEIVEAHDVTAPDPEFLIYLKGAPGTVPVPRHWGRKRKYLQGKRGVEKPPFALPDFIIKTGICDVRDATAEDESKQSVKQKNRARVSGRSGGGVDVDYRTLYEAFFVHQTKPQRMTTFGDLYYEGKEYETRKSSNFRPGHMSDRLREALGMGNEASPPPWIINMQRYGPPPSYPNLRIPGLNAPLPQRASYGYHLGGWGKPPVDAFGRPLYGGDPFGKPEVEANADEGNEGLEDLYGLGSAGGGALGGTVTSDGKAIGKRIWGSLPSAFGDGTEGNEDDDESEEDEEESSDEEMEESEEEEGEEPGQSAADPGKNGAAVTSGMDSVLPDGVDSVMPSSAIDLRKQPGDETPMAGATATGPPKQLYTVLHQTAADEDTRVKSVFASDHAYVLPGAGLVPGPNVPEGAESVLSKKTVSGDGAKRSKNRQTPHDDDDEAEELGKTFKF